MGLLLFHLWLPVLTAFSLARTVAQVFPRATLFPAGAWTLCLGVLVAYTGDRLVEHGRIPPGLVRPLWGVVGVASLVVGGLALSEPVRILPVMLGLGVTTAAYSRIKRGPFTKTVLVTLCWWVGCTLLPFDLLGDGRLHPELLFHPAALGFAIMIAPSTLLCDFKDERADAAAGVQTLPILLGPRGAQLVIGTLALIGAALSFSAGAWAVGVTAALMLAVTPWLSLLRRPLLGPLLVDTLLTAPGLYPFL
jgi:4-hydroxybenzoate polyprenyltransferase